MNTLLVLFATLFYSSLALATTAHKGFVVPLSLYFFQSSSDEKDDDTKESDKDALTNYDFKLGAGWATEMGKRIGSDNHKYHQSRKWQRVPARNRVYVPG